MAKYGSTSALFLVDGYNFLAAKVQSIALKISSMTEQVDGLGDQPQLFAPVNKQMGTVTQSGAFFDTTALSIHDGMATKLGTTPQSTARVICVGIMGNTVGAVLYGIAGAFSVAYEPLLALAKLTKANAEHLLAGLIERGQVVQPLAAETANWDTTATPVDYTTDPSQFPIPITSNSMAAASVVSTPVPHGLTTGQVVLIAGVAGSSPDINGEQTVTVLTPTTFSVPVDTSAGSGGTGGSFLLSSSVNGGSAYQQVSALSGFTGYVGKIRHSADNVTYVDLATFANVTAAPAAERVVVAAGTTVNRYLVHTGTVTGTGSLTVLSAFARK